MPQEVVKILNFRPEGRYVDATLGSGGHAELILQNLGDSGRLLAIDWDPQAIERSSPRLERHGNKAIVRLANFKALPALLSEMGWSEVNGMLFDLGVSSEQMLSSGKGMSFEADEPLDMRTNPEAPLSAQDLIARWDAQKLSELFELYGQFRGARKIARSLQADLENRGSLSARRVSELACRTLPRQGRAHPATRIFLALRAAVNDEMGNLECALSFAPRALAPDGVCALISFQSVEDRAVKIAFRDLTRKGKDEPFRILTPKPLTPSRGEIDRNPRARSAKLRALQRMN